MSEISELQSWEMFRLGDEDSFRLLFDRYNGVLYNYGHKFTENQTLIEDAIQELFVKLWCNREHIGTTASVRNYLLKAFRRTLLRKIIRDKRIVFGTDILAGELPFDIVLPHEVDLIRKEHLQEIKDQLNDALQKMTPRQREIIHLRFFEELEYHEIAEVMSLSVKDTYKLYYRAMDSLKNNYGSFGITLLLYFYAILK